MANLVSIDFVQANFRAATVQDFRWGLQYVVTVRERGNLVRWYKSTIAERNKNLVDELYEFLAQISRGEAWISLGESYYNGIPIGFDD